MHVLRHAPHGTIYTYEGLEMILIMAAYEQDLSVVFIGDGVYALKKGQDTSGVSRVFPVPSWRWMAMMWKNFMSTESHWKNGV